jgi:ABC-type polar amino acid transport system ATPase subunit
MLKGIDIDKQLGTTNILRGASVAIEGGTVTALIGPSGAGKSTLLRALSLVDPPTKGIVQIDDIEYRFPEHNHPLPSTVWPDVTVVFQQLFLWPHLSLRQNIYLPLRKRNKGNGQKFAVDLLRLFELESCLDRFPYEVSIGQRQRAAIVRAMALEPKYLLMDEITSALDVEQVRRLAECIRLVKATGCGIVVVTHLLGFARTVAERVVFMEQGEIIESGVIGLLDNPNHKRVREFLSLA